MTEPPPWRAITGAAHWMPQTTESLDELMPYAMAIAHDIASKSPIALRLAKEAARMTEVMPLRDAYRYEQGNTLALSKTEDAREAQMAFLEKRKPVYKGR